MVTARNASRFLLIRGLIRIIIVDEWLPFLVEHLTYRGLINFGACVKWTPVCDHYFLDFIAYFIFRS